MKQIFYVEVEFGLDTNPELIDITPEQALSTMQVICEDSGAFVKVLSIAQYTTHPVGNRGDAVVAQLSTLASSK